MKNGLAPGDLRHSQPDAQDYTDLEDEDQPFYIKMAEHDLKFEDPNAAVPELKDMAFCLTQCKWGGGEAGPLLMEHLLLTVSEAMLKPQYIVLLDSGVYLATKNTPINSVGPLEKLEKVGVKVLISETSVNQYQQRASIRVGEIVKFMEITRILLTVEKFVNF
jgi:hypothetical protein